MGHLEGEQQRRHLQRPEDMGQAESGSQWGMSRRGVAKVVETVFVKI